MSKSAKKKPDQGVANSQVSPQQPQQPQSVTDQKREADDIRRAVDDGMQDLRIKKPG